MGDRLERLFTRAAGFTPALGNRKNGGSSTSGSGKAPVAATSGIQYISEGQPLRLDWSAQGAAKDAYLGQVWVMACVRTIANTISGLPWVAGMDPTDPADYDTDSPLAKFLGPATPQAPGGPNKRTSSRAFWAWSICQYLVTGRFAWEAQLTGSGKTAPIVALWPLVSAALFPKPTMKGDRWFDGYQYTPATGTITLKEEQVIYCWRPSIEDWRMPESALQAANLPVFIARSVDKYMANLLKNDLTARTMVISPPFEEAAMRRAWQDQFLSEFTGVDRVGSLIFGEMESDEDDPTGKPLVQVERLATTPMDAGLAAAQAQAKIDITIALGVPESLIGNASQRTYANADSEYKNFWTITILPLIAEIQDHINQALAPRVGTEVGWFDLARVEALKPPAIFMPPTITAVIATGVATPDQIANVLGIPASNATSDSDTTTATLGQESSATGAGGSGGSRSVNPNELSFNRREILTLWLEEAGRRQEQQHAENVRHVNTWTIRDGYKHREPRRELIHVRSVMDPAKPKPKLLTSGPGIDKARAITAQALDLRAAATATRMAGKVHDYLAKNYPDTTLGWVDDADWSGPQQIPISEVQMTRRPGGRTLPKVKGIAQAIAKDPDGPAAAPLVLVKTPGKDKLTIADGYHRSLAHRQLGHDTVPAFVGVVDSDTGPWDREMHDKKLNRQLEALSWAVYDDLVAMELSGERYDVSPIGLGKNWVTDVGGLPLFIRAIAHALIRNGHDESEAIQLAVGVVQNWARGQGNGKNHHVTPKTQAKAAAALAEWDAKKAAAHAEPSGKRAVLAGPDGQEVAAVCPCGLVAIYDEGNGWQHADGSVSHTDGESVSQKMNDAIALANGGQRTGFVGEATSTGAGTMLPKGPSKQVADAIDHHKFVGSTLEHCGKCGLSVANPVHRKPTNTGNRHAGPDGHEHVPSGHIRGSLHRQIQAAKGQFASDLGKIEPGIESAMKDHFAAQRQAVLSRLQGKRGKTMLKRAAGTPMTPEGETAPPPPAPVEGANPAAVDPEAVFQTAFWTDRLANTLNQHYSTAAAVAAGRVQHQVHAPSDLDDRASLGAVQSVLQDRANTSAAAITGTTRDGIFQALQDGVVNGTGMPELAKRVNDVFDQADMTRAKMIAQTEAVGSLNQAAHTYASNLPTGIVGAKTWISHHDERTRPTHRLADGQQMPVDRPYLVGGYPMMFPGDPSAPPGEVINCRCGQTFLPPGMSNRVLGSAKSLEGLVPATTLASLKQRFPANA